MKNYFIAICMIFLFAIKAYSYDVIDGKYNGYKVIVDNNSIYLITPQNKRVQVTDYPFIGINNGYHYSDPPVKPIMCSWDPKGRWLVVFIPLKKVTSIYVLDLKSLTQLEGIGPDPEYPKPYLKGEWYSFTKPIKWRDNVLYLQEYIKSSSGSEVNYSEYLIFHGNTFRRVVNSTLTKA